MRRMRTTSRMREMTMRKVRRRRRRRRRLWWRLERRQSRAAQRWRGRFEETLLSKAKARFGLEAQGGGQVHEERKTVVAV